MGKYTEHKLVFQLEKEKRQVHGTITHTIVKKECTDAHTQTDYATTVGGNSQQGTAEIISSVLSPLAPCIIDA